MFAFIDKAALSSVHRTADGYLAGMVRAARTGVQIYGGAEVNRPDMATVKVYRPEAEVFDKDAMASLAHRPVTDNHPAEAVTATNWSRYAKGQTSSNVARDGEYLSVSVLVMDADTVRQIDAGKRELSVGYTAILDWTPGTTPDGQPYDAVQTNIRANHLALVDAGRAGAACRIGDAEIWASTQSRKDQIVTDKPLKTITVDGIPVEVTDQAVAVITKLITQMSDAKADLAKKDSEFTAAIADHAKAIAAKDGEIAALKVQIPDAAKLESLSAERAELVDRAKALVPAFDAKGKSPDTIKREVVAAKLGDAAVKDRDASFIDGAFATLSPDKGNDPLRSALGDTKTQDDIGSTYAARDAALQDAWKTSHKKEV